MKKKLSALTLLAIAAGTLVLTGCDDTPSSSIVETWATSVKITQPGTLVVGDTYKISDHVTTNGGTKYTVVVFSGDGTVISLGSDGDTVTIVGAGKASIRLKGASDNVLGNITFAAMTANGKALQNFVDSLSNNYMIDCVWGEVEETWAEAGDVVTYDYSEGMGLLVNENYIVDGIYSTNYSAVKLQKASGDAYGFNLKNASGNELDYGTLGFENALKTAASVELTTRVSSAYIDNYFVISGLLDVLDYTEGDDGYFTLNDGTTAQNLVGGLLGMSTSSYTGVSAQVKLTDDVLEGVVKFDYNNEAGCALEFKLKKDYTLALLDDAAKNDEAPAALDVTDLATHYAAFNKNFAYDWEIGVFNSYFEPISGYYDYNTVGTTLFYDDSIVVAYGERDATTGKVAEWEVFGYMSAADGIYSVTLDKDNKIVKGELSTTEYTDVYDAWLLTGADFTKTALEAACLSLDASGTTEDGTEYKQYSYEASFDGLKLMAICEGTLPGGGWGWYKKDVANSCDGIIFDYGDEIDSYFGVRVRVDSDIGVQGYATAMYDAGKVTNPIGKKTWEAFPDYFADPSASTGD